VPWGRASLTEAPSRALATEVLYLFGDTSGDGSFVYEHAKDGALVRKLVWFPLLDDAWTAGWLCALGRGEPWEAALFRPGALASTLELERDRFDEQGKAADFPAREARIRQSWADHRIEAGTSFPPADGTVTALLEKHFGLVRPGRRR